MVLLELNNKYVMIPNFMNNEVSYFKTICINIGISQYVPIPTCLPSTGSHSGYMVFACTISTCAEDID